jgi:ATP-dependent Clp protease, protease subunit
MMPRHVAPWFEKACRIHATMKLPRVAAKASDPVNVYVYDAIGFDPWSGEGIGAKQVADQLDAAKGAPLNIRVNSPGGWVTEGIAIYNLIRTYSGPKTVTVDGIAASIASVIALAGDKVVTNEGAVWMVHEPMAWIMAMGTESDLDEAHAAAKAELSKGKQIITDIYTAETGRTAGEIQKWMADETWMSAQESLERGFSDEVFEIAEPADEPAAARVTVTPPAVVRPAARVIPAEAFASLRRQSVIAARARDARARVRPASATTK